MGHAFDWLAVMTDEPEAVRDEMRRFFRAPDAQIAPGDLEEDRSSLAGGVVASKGDWSAIHAGRPLQCGPALMGRLSNKLAVPALFMRVPRDFWEYRLYIGGHEVDRFSQVPELSEPYAESLDAWKGKTAVLGSAFGVSEKVIAKYLVQWPKEAWQRPAEYAEDTRRFSWGKKAHPDDEFPVSDYWVMCDFARRIGLAYEMPPASAVALDL